MPDPGDYPLSLWEQQRAKYWEYWRHFDGDWLDDPVSGTDDSPKYPLKLNPFNIACILHAGLEHFFPVPAPTQYWQLLETFICFEITRRQSELMYGIAAEYDNALYQEWWKRDRYEITVEGKPITWARNLVLHWAGDSLLRSE